MVRPLTEKASQPFGDNTSGDNNQVSESSVTHLFVAEVLMIVGTAGFLAVFLESVLALQGIHEWYPQFVVQEWFIYDELFTVFSFLGLLFGSVATALMVSKKNSTQTLVTGLLSTVSGAGVAVTSLIAPLAVLWKSALYYLLPLFLAPLIGTLLFYHTKLRS
jgi:hypothetical protein